MLEIELLLTAHVAYVEKVKGYSLPEPLKNTRIQQHRRKTARAIEKYIINQDKNRIRYA